MKTILLIAHLIAIATGTGMSIANYINIRVASGEKGERREALAYLRRVLARLADVVIAIIWLRFARPRPSLLPSLAAKSEHV